MKTLWILFLLFFVLHTPAFAQSPIDIRHYIFNLELNDTTDMIAGEATLRIAFTNDTKEFELDLMSKTTSGKGMVVKEVSLNGSKLNFKHRNNKLTVFLTAISETGSELTLDISYTGIPDDGLIISKNKYGDRTFFGDNWPDRARHWLPVVDHPSDKASVEFIVTAPSQYEVIGNGIKQEESILNAKQKLTHWKEEIPLPTKVMVIGAAQFAIQYAGEINNISIQQWVYPQNREAGFHDYAAATKILDFFIRRIGPYSYKKLANVQSKTKFGGMENASNIFYFENSVNGKADHDDLIAHEIAHQWFGNSASETDWPHVWLSEGFATYFTNVYNEFTFGEDVRRKKMEDQRKSVIDFAKKQSLPVVFTTLPADLIEILNTNSYQKGSWVLHMLRLQIGEEPFWKGIRRYYKEYQNSNATTQDFQRIMEGESGQNLDNFFKQWLYTAGHPIIDASWAYNHKSGSIDLTIIQTQANGRVLFEFPLEIGISFGGTGSQKVEKLKISSATTKFSIKTDKKPVKIELDPHVNLLFEGNFRN